MEPASKTLCVFKKSDNGQGSKKEDCVIYLPSSSVLSVGLTSCVETSVQNYHSALCNISEECRPHMIWWCRPWFGSAWSGSEQSGLVWSGLALHMQISYVIYLSAKFVEETLSCIGGNMVYAWNYGHMCCVFSHSRYIIIRYFQKWPGQWQMVSII